MPERFEPQEMQLGDANRINHLVAALGQVFHGQAEKINGIEVQQTQTVE